MANAALVSLRRTIGKIIMNQDQYTMDFYQRDQIRSINELSNVLQEFADKFPDEANYWEGQIRDVENEAQDVLEHFISKKSRTRFGLTKAMRFAMIQRGAKVYRQLEKMREVVDSLAGELIAMAKNGRDKLQLRGSPVESSSSIMVQISDSLSVSMSSRMEDKLQLSIYPAANSPSVIAVTSKINDAVGLDDDSLAIKTRLCGESPNLQVIPIVGMGGIGKTTLCTNVYNDPLTIQYFDVRAWITVSQDYSTQKLVSSLMDSLKEFIVEKDGQSDEVTVYKSLKGRRYLIVIDDMWSKNAWDDLRALFPNDHNGSRIMLTTRLSDVAAYVAQGSSLHEMSFMGIEQSWDLLKQKVFTDQDCSPELENIGWKIAKSCRGLPLAISVIAGLLSMVERSPTSWQEIANNVSSIVVEEDGQINEILSLSYDHLPLHLRDCFLYMGGFPEDHKIRVSKLIRLWVAEGLLEYSDGSSKSLEDEAEECLEDLVSRSLVLVTNRKYNGRIKSCSLHDMIRDLCIRKAEEDSSKSVRLLGVLDPKHLEAPLPDELFRLFHLRYLAISCRRGFTIPAAISKLQNLQTLIIIASRWELMGMPNVECLPEEIWKLRQLRHLICYGRFPYPKETTATLENLERLSLVMHDMCVEGILEKIPNLKNLGVDCSYYDYGTHLNNLEHLHQLESLELRCADWRRDSISFPIMLRKLSLCNMSLPWSEMSLVGSLPNLEVLKLRDFACIGSTWETSEGEFPQLQYLLIETSKLQYWISEEYHFPRLRFLLLHECWYMNEIPEGVGEIATLELIDIRGHTHQVSDSLVESAKRIQEEQQSFGNDSLQVNYPLPND